MAPKKENDDMEPTPEINPWEVLDRLSKALETRQAAPQSDTNDSLMVKLSEALSRLADANIQGSKLIADETRRAHRPSNEVNPGVSVFNRRGTNLPADATGARKPPLKCVVLAPWLVEWDSCTREEVELLNLVQAGDYHLRRIDGSKITLTVQMDYKVDGTPSRMVINHDTGFNNDNFRLVPSFADMLRQILRQHDDKSIQQKAAAVLTDDEEEAAIEAGELSVSA